MCQPLLENRAVEKARRLVAEYFDERSDVNYQGGKEITGCLVCRVQYATSETWTRRALWIRQDR